MAKLSQDLGYELEDLEKQFWVSKEKLKEISRRFEEELAEGLEEEGRNISMNVTWVQSLPTGREKGSFLTVDLGGTNVRVCWITLAERHGETRVKQHQYKLADDIKTGTAEKLWEFLASSVEEFITEHNLPGDGENPIPLGFTFSYPAIQDRIGHGVLQTWTKGWSISGVEGEDVAAQFQGTLHKLHLPVRLIALVNDTTGALVASVYNDEKTIIGAIFGTGCNAAYMEDSESIPKLKGLARTTPMAINCEYGAFDNSHQVLPRTKYDIMIDEESPKPGEQTFEKMSAGLYLGEIYRLALLDLHSKGQVLTSQDVAGIKEPYSIDTEFLSLLENDNSNRLSSTKQRFEQDFDIEISDEELEFSRSLAEMIAVRGARLCACGIAAICHKKGMSSGHVAADGSVANKHPTFKKRWASALAEILDWPLDRDEDPITMTSAEDGSGIGAAVIVALALEKGWT